MTLRIMVYMSDLMVTSETECSLISSKEEELLHSFSVGLHIEHYELI